MESVSTFALRLLLLSEIEESLMQVRNSNPFHEKFVGNFQGSLGLPHSPCLALNISWPGLSALQMVLLPFF